MEPTDAKPTLLSAGRTLLSLFETVADALPHAPKPEYLAQLPLREFKNEHERFVLWVASVRLFGDGDESLDHRVRKAAEVREWVAETLEQLDEGLTELAAIFQGARPPYEETKAARGKSTKPEGRANSAAPGSTAPDSSPESTREDGDGESTESDDSDSPFNEIVTRFDGVKSRINSLYYAAHKLPTLL